MKKEKIIYDSDGIVEYRTNIEGWVGKDGRFYGKDEHSARYANCTHVKCDCGNIMSRGYTKCDTCRSSAVWDKFLALESIEWDGKSMMATYDDDKFFRDWDDVYEYCYDNEISPDTLKLVICHKDNRLREVNIDELNEEYCDEDGRGVSEFHPEIARKAAELNELIRNAEPLLWFADNKRIVIPKALIEEYALEIEAASSEGDIAESSGRKATPK